MASDFKKIILVVEDELALQEAAKIKLEQAGMNVLIASTGEEALELLQRTIPHLVWLDLLLPGMNGIDVLKAIRSEERLKDLPVVIVSVSGGEEKMREAFEMHVADYIIKSEYTIDSIVARVREITEHKK